MAIVRIKQGQPDLAVRLVEPGCGSQLIHHENIRLIITPPLDDCPTHFTNLIFTGCWPGHATPYQSYVEDDRPSLVYDAFEVNGDGEIVFRFDSKMWNLSPGRYTGTVEYKNGGCLASLDLDLSCIPMIIDRVTTTQKPSCGDC